ncbi:hypothetical protein [Chondromyces apiculatus]|uniref:DUF4384 domain-containing protein n=1 Tax=Chondromyces apiculatus DSM 436 TaxID=1192034 RepID=A0A017TAX8_9BACT|nr:hypothetical protein [Chondromyces apiculatus]EYF06399.1 Hypothetical protein CAP_1929 [Chondromyces apiculatus DSM 436]
MNTTDHHPSFLELDRLALGAPTSPETGEHVAHCAACKSHLAALAQPPDLTALPALARRARAASTAQARSSMARRLLWAAPTLAAAAAVLLFIAFRPAPLTTLPEDNDPAAEEAFTTVKGGASVLLHIKRGERVFLWDGAEPVLPGDKLRLEIAPEGFTHVAVLADPRADGPQVPRPTLLYTAPLDPEKPAALPKAWEVDDAAGDEVLVVLLSTSPLDGEDALSLARTPRDGIWTRRLVLPKRPRPEHAP